MFKNIKDILSVGELCDVLNIGKTTAYRLLREGEIKAVRIGRIYKIPKANIEKFILG